MRLYILFTLIFTSFSLFSQLLETPRKVLMVVSSYGEGSGEIRPGYEMDEFSQAYLIFKNNGLTVDIASPKGEKVVADQYNPDKDYNQALLEDKTIQNQLENTLPTAGIDPQEYAAIYIVGGKGAMFDLPYDPSLQDILLSMYLREGMVISSICHGPAVLAQVKNGEDYIIKDVEITGFTNQEEDLFGKKWVKEFPFQLEDKLKSRGAIFTQADFMLAHVAVSGKFITGQNPFSTARSAEEVVKAMGIAPVERKLYADEKSIYLIKEVLNGEKSLEIAANELKEGNETFDMPLIAIYGYYKVLASGEDQEAMRKGVELIELSTPYFFDENLQFVLAKTYITLDEKKKARQVLKELIKRELLVEQSQQLMLDLS